MENVFNKIKNGDLAILDSQVYSEKDLRVLAGIIGSDLSKSLLVRDLILNIPMCGRNFDWNVGSVLQHLEAELVIDTLRENKDVRLVNSIGLAWSLGEFRNTNRIITDFLFGTIENATNSDAWWRSAFSLEKLGLGEAVNLLKMSLKGAPLRDINFYLDHVDDKKSVISILILSNVENIEQVIYPRIKNIFMQSNDDVTVINCCWLIGRLKLIDPQIYSKLFY